MDPIPNPLSQAPGLKAAPEQFPLTAMDSIVAVLLQTRRPNAAKTSLLVFIAETQSQREAP